MEPVRTTSGSGADDQVDSSGKVPKSSLRKRAYRQIAWFFGGLGVLMVVVWAALFLPGSFRPAHEIITCNSFACSHVPESQYYATLYLATGTLFGMAAVFFGLAFMALRISQGRMREQWHLFPGNR